MAKTRRKKTNRSPTKNQQINLFVVEQGERIAVDGHRTAESKMQPNKKATPVFVGRTYTGVNKGKVYPYASAKRGGPVVRGSEGQPLTKRVLAAITGAGESAKLEAEKLAEAKYKSILTA